MCVKKYYTWNIEGNATVDRKIEVFNVSIYLKKQQKVQVIAFLTIACNSYNS